MRPAGSVLVIDDEPIISRTLREILSFHGYQVFPFSDVPTALTALANTKVDLIITDVCLPDLTGLDLVKKLQGDDRRIPIILMTGQATTEMAIEAMKAGAFDFIEKPFTPETISTLVAKAVQTHRLASQTVQISVPASSHSRKNALIGRNPGMLEVCKFIGRVADTPAPVLIQGETGTGKELVARAIFQHSDRRNQPFLAVNCMAIPRELLESELFGHERGAFTGAQNRRIGRFEQASRGTLFLDEIGDLPASLQVKLLRVLQEQVIQRLGSNVDIPVQTRIIAATHKNLDAEVTAGRFREDLFYRLSVGVVTLPPLRDRLDDIPLLVQHFLQLHGPDYGQPNPVVTPESIRLLQKQPWPGNIRELENVIRKALIESNGMPISEGVVASSIYHHVAPHDQEEILTEWVRQKLNDAELQSTPNLYKAITDELDAVLLEEVLQRVGQNKARAAEITGMSRPTLYQKLRTIELNDPSKVWAKKTGRVPRPGPSPEE